MKRLEVVIKGNVQGVFFRYNTQLKARKLSLTGWVKNMPDGTVHAVFEGDSDKLNDILKFCENGPKMAEVSKVIAEYKTPTKEFKDFEIRYNY